MKDGDKRCTCGAGCETFGQCLRRKSIRVAYCQSASGQDYTRQKRWDAELQAYRDARRQGVQPAGTKMPQVRKAMEISETTGQAFDASAVVPPLEG